MALNKSRYCKGTRALPGGKDRFGLVILPSQAAAAGVANILKVLQKMGMTKVSTITILMQHE
jgi:hypothetical protein